MANPNIVAVTSILGETDVGALTNTSAVLVANSATSGKVYKINTIIVSNKSAFSNELSRFAISKSRKFVTFKEDVSNHWYPGTMFGFLY